MKKAQAVLKGYAFRDPKGKLDNTVHSNRRDAWEDAALASERPYNHLEIPTDIKRARKQGFRVVAVTLRVKTPRPLTRAR